MNKELTIFGKQLAGFIILPLVTLALSFPVLDLATKYKLRSYHIKAGTELLFAGDSHVSTALDDHIIPHSVNIAAPGEPYRYTFFKLRTTLSNNPGVKKVVLGLSYHNLSAYLDSNIYGKKGAPITADYFFMLPHDDQWMLLHNFSYDLAPYVQGVLRHGFKDLLKRSGRQPFFGRFENLFDSTRAVDSSMDKRIKYQYYPEGPLAGFSDQNTAWLDSIATLCRNAHVTLAFINTPMNTRYRAGIPSAFIERYNEIIHHYGFPVIDISALSMTDDRFMPDGDHLSVKGAKELSARYAEWLK